MNCPRTDPLLLTVDGLVSNPYPPPLIGCHRRIIGSRGCHLSIESRRPNRQATGWSEPLHDSLREGRDAASPCLLVPHALRLGWLPGRQPAESVCREQLDAIQVQRGRLPCLYFQNESPGKDMESNWLPAPKGPFNLTMRLYSPQPDALTDKWNPPPITKIERAVPLMAQ
jgi:hypothetical protein